MKEIKVSWWKEKKEKILRMMKQSFWVDKDDLHGPGYSKGNMLFQTGFWALDGIYLGHGSKVKEIWGRPLWTKEWKDPLSLSSTRRHAWTKISPAL